MLDVVEALFDAFDTQVPTRVSGNYRLGDMRHNVADTSRLAERLGLHPVGFLLGGRAPLRRMGSHRTLEAIPISVLSMRWRPGKLLKWTSATARWIDPHRNSLTC